MDYREGGKQVKKYAILLVMISLFASGCSNYEKGCALGGNSRFTIVEELNEQGIVAVPMLIVVDNKTGYEYFASYVRGDYCIGGAVLGEDGKPVKIK